MWKENGSILLFFSGIFLPTENLCAWVLSLIFPGRVLGTSGKVLKSIIRKNRERKNTKQKKKKHTSNKHFLTSVFALISGSCPPFQTAAFIKLWKHIAQSFTSKINILGQFTILCHCVFRAVFTFLLGNIFYSDIWKHQP